MHYFKQYFILIKTHDQMLAGNVESYTVGMLALFFFSFFQIQLMQVSAAHTFSFCPE